MIEDLIKASSEPGRWLECAQALNEALRGVDMEAARCKASAAVAESAAEAERTRAMEPYKKLATSIAYAQWPQHRLTYTLGQLDTDGLILCCERRIYSWQQVFDAKAAFGTPQDLEKIWEQARLANTTLDLTSPLRWAAKPVLLVQGLRHEGNIGTAEQLLKMGADPAADGGQVYMNAVLEGRKDIGRVLARYGQNGILNTNTWVDWAFKNRKTKAWQDFREIHWEYGRYQALDAETLVETKPLPDNIGNIRVVFNFASQRVEEIHETYNPRQALVTSYAFDDYGQPALEAARQKLIELGGNPSDVGHTLRGKGAIAKPAPFSLGNNRT